MASATQKQIDYIEILAFDLNMTRAQRQDYCSIRAGRRVLYLDDLLSKEASQIIGDMLHDKEQRRANSSEKGVAKDES